VVTSQVIFQGPEQVVVWGISRCHNPGDLDLYMISTDGYLSLW
jgi:hypothetical protein